MLGRRLEADQARAAIARNEFVVNGGLWLSFRTQFLAGDGINNPMGGTMPTLGMNGQPNFSGSAVDGVRDAFGPAPRAFAGPGRPAIAERVD